jgi:D-alanyl-D-alanine carboxypeptidase
MRNGLVRLARLSKMLGLALVLVASPALANPELVVDVDSGQVLLGRESTAKWYPAALTTLMTVYVALNAVRDGRVSMDTPFVVSNRAANMPPSRMGFQPGVQVTLDNALKLLVVKSPNDVAVTVAEGISGSVEAFVDDMNAAGAKLGLKESHFVNPTGLPDSRQVTSARDMAMIGRALLKEFPEHNDLFGIGALQLGDRIIPTRNSLIGRYAGADGMRTGFTCAAGLNVVASATRRGRRLIVVVLGASTATERLARAAALLDLGFAKKGGAIGTLEDLPSLGVKDPPNMRAEACLGKDDKAETAEADETKEWTTTAAIATGGRGRARDMSISAQPPRPRAPHPRVLAAMLPVHLEPLPVFIGPKPGWTGPVAGSRTPDVAIQQSASPVATPLEAGKNAPQRDTQVAAEDQVTPKDQVAPEDQAPPFTSAALQGVVDRPSGSTIVARSPATNVVTRDGPFTPSQETQTNARVPLEELGGIFTIPVLVNSTIRLNFIIDSGSADVSIPADVVLTLMRTGTLRDTDFIGKQSYKLADGSTVPSVTFRIRSLKVGDREIQDVTASVTAVEGSLLLGQTFLSRFKSWSIDNQREVLLLN